MMTYPPTRFPNAGPGYPGLFPNGSVLWFNQVRAARGGCDSDAVAVMKC
jgi:hypothetical protein